MSFVNGLQDRWERLRVPVVRTNTNSSESNLDIRPRVLHNVRVRWTISKFVGNGHFGQ